MDEPDRKKGGRLWFSVIVVSALVAVVIAVALPSYGDYKPQASVSEVVVLASALREQFASSCKDESSRVAQQAVDLAAAQPLQSKVVAERKLRIERDGAVALEFKLNEIRWGAPWRQWSVAIPGGSTVIFDGRCRGAEKFEWRVSKLTSVPAKFLPLALREQLQ